MVPSLTIRTNCHHSYLALTIGSADAADETRIYGGPLDHYPSQSRRLTPYIRSTDTTGLTDMGMGRWSQAQTPPAEACFLISQPHVASATGCGGASAPTGMSLFVRALFCARCKT